MRPSPSASQEPATPKRPSPRERALLYSIWLILSLAGLLYWFWPTKMPSPPPQVTVFIAPELQSWFSTGELKSVSSQYLELELRFHPKPLDALGQVRSVQLGYDFGRDKKTLYRNTLLWTPQQRRATDPPSLRLQLPNPQGTLPSWIRLYFADPR